MTRTDLINKVAKTTRKAVNRSFEEDAEIIDVETGEVTEIKTKNN